MPTDEQIIQLLKAYGHLEYPFGKFADYIQDTDLGKLTLQSTIVKEAVRSWQDVMSYTAGFLISKYHPSRRSAAIQVDGDVGPATRELFEVERCGLPDYTGIQPLLGSGGWKECHGGNNIHQIRILIKNSPPSHVAEVWDQVWSRFAASYAEIGLEIKQAGSGDPYETTMEFVGRSDGWIGLAIVGPGSCGRPIWARFLSTYRPRDVVTEWATLLMHEIGHNCGLQHSRGGVMNPSIINGLPPSWKNDPSYPILKRSFGGEPIPSDEPGGRKMVVGYEYDNGTFEKLYDLPTGGDFWPGG